ncbi:MAG: hypothetical protein HLUCCO16_13580 [Phormidium sp. OSCR]|nr:MAG: hypothetical protein HLUCCO16_13580 [Phormidium sp. OSCR]
MHPDGGEGYGSPFFFLAGNGALGESSLKNEQGKTGTRLL